MIFLPPERQQWFTGNSFSAAVIPGREKCLFMMGKADLHIHTTYSDGTCTVAAALEWAANYTELDVIAITDHDTLDGAREAMQLGPKFGIQVIPGCEITTRDGHLLALFIERTIPYGLSMHESVLRVAAQGGLCIPAHPTDRLAHGASQHTLQNILRDPDAARAMVGLEAINTGIFAQRSNLEAQRMAELFGLSPTGSSDSHVFWTIGSGFTRFPGHTGEDVRRALLQGTTTASRAAPGRSPTYWPRHVLSFMLRKAGWVTWTPEPNASLRLQRVHRL